MSELLPDRLGCLKSGEITEDQATSRPMARKRYISTILQWIQCFGIHMAVLAQKHPERISDLLGYQHLINKTSLEYKGDNWLLTTDNSVLLQQLLKTQLGDMLTKHCGVQHFLQRPKPPTASTALVSTIKLLNVDGPQSTQCKTQYYS